MLSNANYEIYLFTKGRPNSLLSKLVTNVKNKTLSFAYQEVIRKIDPNANHNHNVFSATNANSNQIIERRISIDEVREESKQCKEVLIFSYHRRSRVSA